MLEVLHGVITFLDKHIVDGVFISVGVILFARFFLKSLDTRYALSLIAWFLFSFACLGILNCFTILLTLDNELIESAYFVRAKGPYKVFYFVMLGSTFLPMLLLIKNLRKRILVVLAIAILMNIGWLFESFVIHTTSMHRDYDSEGWLHDLLPRYREGIIFLKVIFVGVIVLILGNLIARRQSAS